MESFRQTHPNYATYASEHFYVTEVPLAVQNGLHGLLAKHSESTNVLKNVTNTVLGSLPAPPSTNWGYDWIMGDLDHALDALSKKPLHKFMDCMGELIELLDATNFPSELEDLLAEENLGYMAQRNGPDWRWVLRDEGTEVGVAVIEDAQAEIGDVCEQSLLHLQQAKENLKRGDERSRKDAVRDAMSAMESLYKSLSGQNDIADAYKAMRDEKKWGPNEILKDGYSIWNTLHQLYPDIRHGQASPTKLSDEEAQYWLGRITLFVKYIARLDV